MPDVPRPRRRVAIALSATVLGLGVATLAIGALDLARVGTADGLDWLRLALSALLVGIPGALLTLRVPRNALGWIVLGSAAVLGLAGASEVWAVYALSTATGSVAGSGVWALWVSERFTAFVSVGLPLLLLLFPDGAPIGRRWRWMIGAVIGNVVVLTLAGILHPVPLGEDSEVAALHGIANPTGWPGGHAVLDAVLDVTYPLHVSSLAVGLVALGLRYRRGRAVQRAQVRWLLLAAAVYLVQVLAPVPGAAAQMVFELVATAGLALAITIAVLRYRLFDIDVVLNRTLVYGLLTGCVVAGYVGIVAALGSLLQARSSLTVSLVATGVVAAVFSPLRSRLQRGVDRLTYGDRRDPRRALLRLGERLAGGGRPEQLLEAIAGSVAESLRLPFVRVEAATEAGLRTAEAGSEPEAERPVRRLPLVFAGDQVGTLVVGVRDGENRFTAADLQVLDELARQAAVAVRAVDLMSQVQRSREELVLAREEERRRLRQDLHDGLGPTLAGIGVRAETAGRLARRDPETAEGALRTIAEDARAAVAEVRRIVTDLRPASLDQVGLVGALEAEARRYAPALTVRVSAAPLRDPLPAAVEVAVLRIAAEALANAARHAAARRIEVSLDWTPDGRLRLQVADDGSGIPDAPVPGVGLESMSRRAAELDGDCRWTARPGGGTTLTATIPVDRAPATVAVPHNGLRSAS